MDKVKLYYAKIGNMGDLLNVLIIEKCFGLQVERHSFLDGDMCAIGSCLGMYTLHGSTAMRMRQRINGITHPSVSIWGTGFINYTDCESPFFKKRMDFKAVRGELTRQNIEKMTGRSWNIPTGDAGILACELLEQLPAKKHRVGIIPHICDLKDEAVQQLTASYEDSVMINVKDDPLTVVRQIAECETILSSSLHGLIVADSFDIPNRHIVFGDRLLGDGYKFDDYYSAYGVEHIISDLQTSSAPALEDVIIAYAVTPEMSSGKRQDMRNAFPFPKA